MLASDVKNPEFAGARDPDSVMVARFYVKAVQNNWETQKQGRPIFEDRIYCEYYPQGQRLLVMDVPATDGHKKRFARQWAAFEMSQHGVGQEIGTPLSQWPLLSPAMVMELNGIKFFTVEAIANASDQLLQTMGMGYANMSPMTLRERAKAFLGVASGTAVPQQQAQELAEAKEKLARLEEQMAQLLQERNTPFSPPDRKSAWSPERRKAFGEAMKARREAKKAQQTEA